MREVTTEDKALARTIVSEVDFVWTDVHKHINWRHHKAEAFRLARDIKGYHPSSMTCIACNFKALNIVRDIADLPPIGGEASESLRERRVKVCRGDAEDGSRACEHLAWPGLNCGKCGCFVDIKASFKRFRCPINRWPIA
jgi:hypothetical protein